MEAFFVGFIKFRFSTFEIAVPKSNSVLILKNKSVPIPIVMIRRNNLIALFALLLVGCDAAPSVSNSSTKTAGTVQLEIDFGGKRENISVHVPCSADSTAFQILERARNMGDLEFESTGQQETAFVASIGGVKNEGAAGRNWLFEVNGKLANQGSGSFLVKKDDLIRWRMGDYP